MSKIMNVLVGAVVVIEEAFEKKISRGIETLARKGEEAAAEKAAKKTLEALSPEEVAALRNLLK